jgi:hypothetical protein
MILTRWRAPTQRTAAVGQLRNLEEEHGGFGFLAGLKVVKESAKVGSI